MGTGRWWLALGYLLATLVAQSPHAHDHPSDEAAESRGDCSDLGRHIAGHDPAKPHEAPEPCPACQFRAESPLLHSAPRAMAGPSVAIPRENSRPSTRPGSPLRTSCRAPPHA
ncbi:hypothetical protein TA3x_005085 [Tundrisphaera sp. TA3]|uniref:hypothetical protein n=1 Tax=Tundrisphaera sp. TA3 TaxID=3435775 RepID=UPI003EBB9D6B